MTFSIQEDEFVLTKRLWLIYSIHNRYAYILSHGFSLLKSSKLDNWNRLIINTEDNHGWENETQKPLVSTKKKKEWMAGKELGLTLADVGVSIKILFKTKLMTYYNT